MDSYELDEFAIPAETSCFSCDLYEILWEEKLAKRRIQACPYKDFIDVEDAFIHLQSTSSLTAIYAIIGILLSQAIAFIKPRYERWRDTRSTQTDAASTLSVVPEVTQTKKDWAYTFMLDRPSFESLMRENKKLREMKTYLSAIKPIDYTHYPKWRRPDVARNRTVSLHKLV
ncbi:hypothetical protein LSAT2_014778 [Lamellibrachia satsuma]|nr:hypothetical protein LSAT2_014778 [Lamellibrachia satsuma]